METNNGTRPGLVFGVIADDLTGGLELASMLVARGIPTSLSVGIEMPADIRTAHVIALKSRVAPVEDAVRSTLAALDILLDRGARQIFFKYCATFDSTPGGNIGPCAEAIMERLRTDQAFFVPALCETRRTVYQGHMFGGEELLGESSKRFDPLTPMTDSNLVRVLQGQSRRSVGLIDYTVVDRGPDAIRSNAQDQAARAGKSLFIADTLYEHHLAALARASADMRFLTGNSSVTAHLPPIWLERGLVEQASAIRLAPVDGPGAVLVGSVAPQSAAQLKRFSATSPVCTVDIARAYAGHDLVEEARRFAVSAIASGGNFAISTALPQHRIDELQSAHGRLELGARAEGILSEIAKVIVLELGVRRLVVAGGETSGAIVRALGIRDLQPGPYREPGFSRAVATEPFPIALMLKSGKLGSIDLFATALEDMCHPIAEDPLLTRWPPKG
ncbi:four-carbon acid sugar kinase family protein [Neorhizobium sp. P12A]|uniref:3-oxo-tetronate kinase n=1 Tax=Neorhizobium sp. P12A TaxID=2268027 RepID=UPI00139EB606|nr:3-oxo-tetronate kinase [Neorhizobium sp. P12A]KAA0697969.1 four-carbon acid sugar kinase family protein [Neorhizobium sp. P12A]